MQPVTTDPLIRPEGVYVGATEGATRYRPEEASMTDPTPTHALDANGDGKPDYSHSGGRALLGPLAPYAKTVVAFFAPGVLLIAAGPLAAGRVPTASEWLMALGIALSTALAVYAVPNLPHKPTRSAVE